MTYYAVEVFVYSKDHRELAEVGWKCLQIWHEVLLWPWRGRNRLSPRYMSHGFCNVIRHVAPSLSQTRRQSLYDSSECVWIFKLAQISNFHKSFLTSTLRNGKFSQRFPIFGLITGPVDNFATSELAILKLDP